MIPALASENGGSSIEQVRVRVLPDGRLVAEDAATFVGHKPKTMAMWRIQGKGPRWVKVGGRVFYYLEDLKAWIRNQGRGVAE